MPKKLKSIKNPNPNVRAILVQFKVNAAEMRELWKRSGAWTKGNLSEYMRTAVLNFQPGKGDFQK